MEQIAEGSYGTAYIAKNVLNNNEKIVIKVEKSDLSIGTLLYEAQVLMILNKNKNKQC